MMANNVLAPPRLEPNKYESWRKEMSIWEMATNVVLKKRAPTVFLALTGKAREAVLEMDSSLLHADDGMAKLFEKLDSLFKVDEDQAALNAYEKFEKYTRPSDTSMADYRIEFDRLVQQLKSYKIELPEPVLAYRALKSANLSAENERLVRATVPSIKLNVMMLQLQKVSGMHEDIAKEKEASPAVRVKQELDVAYTASDDCKSLDGSEEVYYNSNTSNFRSRFGGFRRGGGYNFRRGGRGRNRARGSKKFNPPGPDGNPSTCGECGSTMHWFRECPHVDKVDKFSKDSTHDAHIVLMNIEETEDEKSSLLGQTVGSTILDSGCSRSVCGYVWYQCYLDTLSEEVREGISTNKSESTFRFGNGSELKSMFNVNLPCMLAGKNVQINVDVISSEIPLLLSKKAMKKAQFLLDFKNDTVSIFGKKQSLNCTESGHYFIPLAKPMVITKDRSDVLFMKGINTKSRKDKLKIAEKLHKQFSHPSRDKLTSLVKSSGVKDGEFLEIISDLPSKCEICVRYKKVQPKPVVGFPLASHFNEVVAMDIKELKGVKILHMIDHATRYSVAAILKNKESKEIISVVFRYWISYFGAPKSFLTDNGREFNNQEFRDMSQNMNIVVKTTAAQSPWSNGLNERHNGILGEMVTKTLEDGLCSMEVALGWSVSAKNTLHNVNGFSPNQLVFGFNPNMPSMLINSPPALEGISTSEVVANNLNALHAARRAFIQSESSERLQRALRHQVRGTLAAEFLNGDMVFFKRNEGDRWMGPGTVIGTENKQILVKHGGTYVRVHPCRIQRYHGKNSVILNDNSADVISDNPTADNSNCAGIHDDLEHSNDFSFEYVADDSNVETPEENNFQTECEKNPSSKKYQCVGKKDKLSVPLPKPGQNIRCKIVDEQGAECWKNLKVISRGGKSTGKNKFVMNVSIEDTNPVWLDFEHGVLEWKHISEEEGSDGVDDFEDATEEAFLSSHSNDDLFKAKMSELGSWEENGVYTQVSDIGQDKIQTRWICTAKDTPSGKAIKARLVAKGFQDPDSSSIRSDSPTCAKESLRLVLALIAAKGWSLNSMDIKTAFLQGKKFDRIVHVVPPSEAEVPRGCLWKLNKCVYGLSDASRVWYMTVKEELLKLGGNVSKHDEAIFTFYDGHELQGIVSTHVDDFCWAGTKHFANKVISSIRSVFVVKSEDKHTFKYLGLDLSQEFNQILIKQDKFVQGLDMIPMRKPYSPDDKMTESELKCCRSALGKLNWLATQTRPDLAFDVSDHTSTLKDRRVESISRINKTIRKAKRESSQIVVPCMTDLEKCRIVAYSDASFANLHGTKSQGGYIIYLVDPNNKSFPLAWQSQKVKRVVKSTHAAETLAMVDAAEACVFYRQFILEILRVSSSNGRLSIVCKTDNTALHGSVYSSTQILDKRLRIETAILREMLARREIDSIKWVSTSDQLADALTKSGVPSKKILCGLSQ